MTDISIQQMPAFKRAYKKLHAQDRVKVNAAIREIVQDPKLGQEKKVICQVHVYKFKIYHQEMLLAYEWNPQARLLLALGVHENFDRDLRNLNSC